MKKQLTDNDLVFSMYGTLFLSSPLCALLGGIVDMMYNLNLIMLFFFTPFIIGAFGMSYMVDKEDEKL